MKISRKLNLASVLPGLLAPIFLGINLQADPVVTPSNLFTVNGNTVTTGANNGTFTGVTVSNGAATIVILGQSSGTPLELDNNTNSDELSLGNSSAVTIQPGTALNNTASTNAILLGSGSLDSSGVIMGFTNAVNITGAGTVTNSGQIFAANSLTTPTSGNDAVLLGNGSVKNVGLFAQIVGYFNGVEINGVGSVSNEGIIAGFSNGIVLHGGGTVTNTGTGEILAETGDAIQITGNGSVTSSGTIQGETNGITISGVGTVTNQGGLIFGVNSLTTPTAGNDGILLGGGSVTSLNSGSGTPAEIVGFVNGVEINSNGSVTNEGIIAGFSNGIILHDGGTVTNTGTSGQILGVMGDAVQITGNGVVTSSGTIQGINNGVSISGAGTVINQGGVIFGVDSLTTPTAGNDGILLGSGSVTNLSFGSGTPAEIVGYVNGVEIDGHGAVFNEGIIAGFSNGILLHDGGTVTNTGTNSQILGVMGDAIQIAGNGTVTSSGTIQGVVNGISITGNGTVTNQGGQIFGVNSLTTPTAGNDGILLDSGSVKNLSSGSTGEIVGYVNGVEINSNGSVINQGEIAGFANGIVFNAGGSVTSSGSNSFILGQTGDAIKIIGEGTVTTSGGIIQGGINGVVINGSGNVVNSGGAIYGVDSISTPAAGNDGVLLSSGSVSNLGAASKIFGYTNGIEINNAGSVFNGGEIEGIGNAIFIHGDGTINNSGTIAADNQNSIFMVGMGNSLSLVNSGIIQAAENGIYDEVGTLTYLNNTGTITGLDGAINVGAIGTLINSGTIGETAGGTGILVSGSGNIILNGGTVIGSTWAVVTDNANNMLPNKTVVTINGRTHLQGMMQDNDTDGPATLNLNLVGLTPAQLEEVKAASALTNGTFTIGANTYTWNNFNVEDNSISLELAVDSGLKDVATRIDNSQQGLPAAYDSLYVAAASDPEGALNSLVGRQFIDAFSQMGLSNATQFGSQADTRAFALRSGSTGIDFSALNLSPNTMIASLGNMQNALTRMSGSLMGGTELVSDSKDDKSLLSAASPRWGAWAAGTVTFADQSATSTTPGYNATSGSPTFGIDYRICPELIMGALFNYTTGGVNFGDGSNLNTNTYLGGIYVDWTHKGWFVNGLAAGGVTSYDQNRTTIGGANAQASPSGSEELATLSTGYDFKAAGWVISPEIGLQFTHLNKDAFNESGAGAFDLNVGTQEINSLRTKLGFNAAHPFTFGGVKLTPQLNAFWYHECLDVTDGVSNSLPGAPGLGSFVVQTNPEGRDFALVGAGVNATPDSWHGNVSFFVNYEAQVGQQNFMSNTVDGGVRVGF